MLLRKFLLHLFFPGGLLAAGALWVLKFWDRPPEVTAFLPFVPTLVLAFCLLLGLRFNRTRLIYVLLLLTVTDLFLKGAGAALPTVYAAAGFLLPINLLLVSFFVERGFFTPPGYARLFVFALQPFFLAGIHQAYPQPLLALMTAPLFVWPRPFFPGLPHPALAATAFVGLILLLRLVRRPTALEAGFFWVLVCTATPLLLGMQGLDLTLWLSVAGIIMSAALIEMSHGMAFRDDLTGLPARRALNEEMLKMGRSCVVAMVDIDHFKKVNDTHGHDVGDQVLKMVAARLQRVTGGGRPFRYGGEEFTILFPGRTAKEVLPHLEELRKVIGSAPFTLRHPSRPARKPASGGGKVGTKQLSVTVSIGVSERRDGSSAEAVFKSADQALYQAKQGGRNRVCVRPVGRV